MNNATRIDLNEFTCPECGHPVMVACSLPSILEIEFICDSDESGCASIDDIELKLDATGSYLDPFNLICTQDIEHNVTDLEDHWFWDEIRPKLVVLLKNQLTAYTENL